MLSRLCLGRLHGKVHLQLVKVPFWSHFWIAIGSGFPYWRPESGFASFWFITLISVILVSAIVKMAMVNGAGGTKKEVKMELTKEPEVSTPRTTSGAYGLVKRKPLP